MVLATSNKEKQLLSIRYIGHVSVGELTQNRDDLKGLLAELKPGFRLLSDFSDLELMDTDCATEAGQLMDLADQAGVSLVVRVIPDPRKDIGMNILTIFHYQNRPRVVTCANMTEAVGELSL